MKAKALVVIITLCLFTLFLGACGSPACGDANWQDITWKLQSYGYPGDPQAVIGNGITLRFVSIDKSFNGTSGCNQYSGSYTISRSCVLKLSAISSTLMACLDNNLMQQEQTYLGIIKDAGKLEITGGEMHITCGAKVLIFTP
ncbi:MAG: META domain-containing protein [Dehalococcoidales bacterium]|nr:META domain-containing protein [Dehalococcoidales bacterium]